MQSLLLVIFFIVSSTPFAGGVSISIAQPGFYGQINLGNHYPAPQLIYSSPIVAIQPAVMVPQQPVYLYVPPGHAKRWDKYCHRYNACYQAVYFVKKDWYNNVYLPYYRKDKGRHNHNPSEYGNFGSYRGNDSSDHSPQKYETHRYVDKKSRERHYDHGYHSERSNNDSKKYNDREHRGQGQKDHGRGDRRD